MKKIVLGVALVVAFAGVAGAADYNLSTLGSSAWINGALFTTTELQPTGTGVIDPFLKFQGQPRDYTQAYNYDRATFGDISGNDSYGTANWTTLLLTSDLATVTFGGETYWKFLLDIDQQGGSPFISLDYLTFSTSGSANFHGAITDPTPGTLAGLTFPPLGDIFWSLGANRVMLNYGLNSGSGSGDLFVYVPIPDTYGAYLYLANALGYSDTMFGNVTTENDGPEEWAALLGPGESVPEPGSMLLFGIGLIGFARAARSRRR